MPENKKILLLSVILGCLCFGDVIYNNTSVRYSFLFLVPLFFTLLCINAIKIIGSHKSNIGFLIVIGIANVRYVILPWLMVKGNFFSIMDKTTNEDIHLAICLMLYEMLAIFLGFYYAYREDKNQEVSHRVKLKNNKRIKRLAIFILGYCLVFLIFRPSVLDNYMTVFDLNSEKFTMAGRLEKIETGTIMRVLQTLYTFFFNIVRVLLPAYVIKWSSGFKSNIVMIIIVILMVLLQFLFITPTFAESIISAVVIVVVSMRINVSVGRMMIKSCVVMIAVLLGTAILLKSTNPQSMYSGANVYSFLSAWTNAYFSGIDNIAAIVSLPETNRLHYIFSSIQLTIPFNTTLFGKVEEPLQLFFNDYNNSYGQIPPTIGVGYYYLGFLLAPLFSFFFSYFSIKFGLKAQKCSEFSSYVGYILSMVIMAMGTGMYNDVISIGMFNMWALPILLLRPLSKLKISLSSPCLYSK